jgi:trk system potassium uptake protein TrkH
MGRTSIFILTLLMIIGAGACSTGGGIKWLRIGILAKGMWWEIKSLLLPKSAVILFHAKFTIYKILK